MAAHQGPVTNNCPSDQTVSIAQGTNLAMVTWVEPTFTSDLETVIPISTHRPGDLFPVGRTLVTYLATDSTGSQDICKFFVNVTVEGKSVMEIAVTRKVHVYE